MSLLSSPPSLPSPSMFPQSRPPPSHTRHMLVFFPQSISADRRGTKRAAPHPLPHRHYFCSSCSSRPPVPGPSARRERTERSTFTAIFVAQRCGRARTWKRKALGKRKRSRRGSERRLRNARVSNAAKGEAATQCHPDCGSDKNPPRRAQRKDTGEKSF